MAMCVVITMVMRVFVMIGVIVTIVIMVIVTVVIMPVIVMTVCRKDRSIAEFQLQSPRCLKQRHNMRIRRQFF
ncbi:hypothetical protein GCM10007921_39740 [Tritonibacter mobilis]|nr:hypothetical protein GCM10007921_39740 [Tritonibacter mobilis]